MESHFLPSEDSRKSEFLDRIRSLPPFHPVASEVLRLFSSNTDGFQVDELAATLSRDPAFAAELLQNANSPLFGLKSSVHTVTRAIIVLGLEHTKMLAIRTAMQIYFKDAPLEYNRLRRVYRNLTINGVIPDEGEWLKALGASSSGLEEPTRAFSGLSLKGTGHRA